MQKELTGKVALVTGGSRGIGAATARALADKGADVAVSYAASAEKAEAVVKELTALGVRAAAFKADQAAPAQVRGLIADVVAHFGRLDILVNNAGVLTPGRLDDPSVDPDALARQYAVNIGGVTTAMRAAVPVMADGGRIIIVGSCVASRAAFPGLADYVATKAAVAGYAKGAAHDLGPRGITVNVVQPGPTATDMSPDSGDFAAVLKANTALGRFASPEDIAAGIAFLAGPGAAYITGTALAIDGGFAA
ncbi:SDR family NAD(P)-dependent oxidoreductase [Desulfovibrio sp. TomC]|uniref:SDR family NAD(P)-dependent oxidoreductase n=1 Tax=Desulfovibrio sp. TomC TaxID=1562888 RepID=UPI0005747CC2|nr:SDR family oxidoreductase [Desulfovibrio sp. TomC]KHK03264.1 oxidoreductase, short-chain dehydrogenase-reductase family (fabG) [Desulfovibrio sp. TomC]